MPVPTKLDHCVIHVSDWERSNAFYRDVMGAELVQRPAGWAYRFGDKQLNVHGKGVTPGRGGAAAGAARQQRSVLRMGRPDRGRDRASEAPQRRGRGRADAALRRQGRGHQRLFPRSRRLADGIHVVPGTLRRPWPRPSTIRLVLPDNLPVPQDDGAARHLAGMRLPDVALAATDGTRGQSFEARGPHRGLCLSAHRAARAGAADRLGRDPGRARLHAAVLRLPRSFRRAEAARRGAAVRSFDAGHRLSARGGGAAAPAVSRSCRMRSSSSPARSSCRRFRSTA